MKLSDLKTIDQIVEERRQEDPKFAADWDRSAFAREVAVAVIKYRAERNLTQQQLADTTGLKQPAIARLEVGEKPPSLATLAKLSKATGLRFRLEIAHGDVALPGGHVEAPSGGVRIAMTFAVRHRDGEMLSADKLARESTRLMDELLRLEECNDNLHAPTTSSDADDGTVEIAVGVITGNASEAMRFAHDIARTAIHAICGRTPNWDSAPDAGRPDCRPESEQFDYV
jgi:transcriptional regulator with XRE-family HTH domain